MNTMTLTRRIRSPEDIQVGDYVVKSFTHFQLVPGPLEPKVAGESVEPIILTGWSCGAGEPLEVLAVCLPFVMVKCCTYGIREAIDTRQHVLAKVSKAYARAAKPKPEKEKKKGKGKKRKKNKKK
ncbi:MAG: hypothetical protein ACPG4Q_03650 [Phycisphaeraceae bacterium]